MSLKHRFFIMCGAFVAGILIALLCELWPALSVLIPIGALLPLGGVIWGVISIRCIFVPLLLYALLPALRQGS